MPLLRAQCVFPYASGLPEDVITNTLYFDDASGFDVELTEATLTGALRSFFDGCKATDGWSAFINQANAEVRWYDMSDPAPRVPNIIPLELTNVSSLNSPVPAECAIVLSFQGAIVAGGNQARRRGRIYIGGIGAGFDQSTSVDPPRVSLATRDNICEAAEGLMEDAATALAPWVVHSPTAGTNTVVTNGWVDNEPDTQRRRGVVASVRSLWPD